MIALAVLNVVLVTDNIVSSGFKVSPTLILAASFQVHLDTQYTGPVHRSPKTAKKTFSLLKPKSEILKKNESMKISSFLNGFRIKIIGKI